MTQDKFYSDMVQLATQSPKDAADVGSTWRNRFLNMAEGGRSALKSGLSVGAGALVGLGFGALGGRWRAEDDDIMEDWKAGGYASAGLASADAGSPYREGHEKMPDRYPGMKPGTVWGVPITMLVTAGLGLAALVKAGGPEWNAPIEAGAFAGVVYWTSVIGDQFGYDMKMAAIEGEGASMSSQAA